MAAYTYKDVCFRDDFQALIPDFEDRYKRECDHEANYNGDYWLITDMLLGNKDATIRTQQAEIERLKGQRTELIRELKWTVDGLDDYYYDHAAEQVAATRALIAEIEAEK